MLVKEYRISLPMSVEEYRIAQLYMIQRKSREESQGAGSGVEILTNQPYTEGPGGSGQYTYKIYHIGSHLPGWFRAILPKSALRVEEEAWNAYPYTKTRYRCPFVEKFVLEVETHYLNDGGDRENLFGLSNSELKDRTLDFIDIVKDPISSGDYRKEEDPKIFKSAKTDRGPLNDNWRVEYAEANRNGHADKKIMTAYKLCRVEFKYWGMQNKIERFIHDIGLRKTMLRAHRQAWCWQDEYYGLKLSDIRQLELETQLALQETMAEAIEEDDNNFSTDNQNESKKKSIKRKVPTEQLTNNVDVSSKASDQNTNNQCRVPLSVVQKSASLDRVKNIRGRQSPGVSSSSQHSIRSKNRQISKSKSSLDSSHVSDWRFQSLEQLQESSSDEDEFFDAQGLSGQDDVFNSDLELSDSESETNASDGLQVRSSSLETLSVSNDEFADARSQLSFETESPGGRRFERLCQKYSLETGNFEKNTSVPPLCKTNTLFLIVHGGSLLDTAYDHFNTSKRSDYNTLKATFDLVIGSNYPAAKGRVALRLVPCPQICAEALSVLSSLSPFGFDAMSPNTTDSSLPWSQEFVPLGAVGLFSACNPEYQDHVNSVIAKANLVYMDFLQSDEGKGFNGQVCILSDATGSILTYDALCRSKVTLHHRDGQYGSHSSDLDERDERPSRFESTHTLCETHDEADNVTVLTNQNNAAEQSNNQIDKSAGTSSVCKTGADSGSTGDNKIWDNDGSLNRPFSVDSAVKRHSVPRDSGITGMERVQRGMSESYAYATKPLLHKTDSVPVQFRSHADKGGNTIRLHVTPSSDGDSMARRTSGDSHFETLTFNFEVADFFMLGSPLGLVLSYRRMFAGENKTNSPQKPDCQQMYNLFHASDPSAFRLEPLLNYVFRQIPPIKVARYNKFPMGDGESIQIVSSKWWGNKRLDYMLYCPEILHSFPVRALPPLFHASFWESTDVAAFVLRQVLQQDLGFSYQEEDLGQSINLSTEETNQPKEKWQKKRTMYKVRNLQPNHRGNDVLALEDHPQVVSAKFMYGPLDMTSLSGEKTDIHVMSSTGDWTYMGTEVTDGHGRLTFTIPTDKRLSQGIHPVKMVVRVDHTTADLFLSVLPPRTETVIFSIDGSFTASVSIMGKDPKVKPGAVDVVRHWQELGYLILYVTARPDMQHNKVVAWLAQHNFPHGMVAFMDGFSKDPLKQKFNYLRSLQKDADLSFRAGYGSSKDVNGYRELGLSRDRIFIVGKSNKKQQTLCTFISSGYAAHLELLMNPGGSRPASGNAVFLLRKTCFSLPATENKRGSKRGSRLDPGPAQAQFDVPSFVRQESSNPQTLITVSDQGNTLLQPVQPSFGAAVRARGTSPRPKMTIDSHR